MRRIGAWLGLAFLGVVVPVTVALAAFAPGIADAAGCQPVITSVTPQFNAYVGAGRVDVRGSCFGHAAGFDGEDRSFFRVSDLGVNGTLPNSLWNACWTGDPGTDTVTCKVPEWTDTHVVFFGFVGGGGPYVVHLHDRIAFQVWNAQTGAGPAVALLGGSGVTVAANPHQSSIAHRLASPTDAFRSVSSDIINGTIAVGAVLFITFPANLFNQTFEENYADIRAWWRRKFRWLLGARATEPQASEAAEASSGPRAFAAVIVGGAFLGGLLDPEFGFNLRSVLTVVALVLAIGAGIAIPALVAQAFYRSRHSTASLQVRALPAGLAIAAACVFISRVSGFQPGYLYGIVAGVVLGRALNRREQAHLIILTTLAVIAASVIAWIAWAGINGTAKQADANDMLVLVDDALAAMFVAGLVGSVIGLLPLRFLPGHTLKSWSLRAWAAVFVVSMFGLIQVMLRPNATDESSSHAPLVTTLMLFVAFAVGTIAFRWHFIRKQLRAAGQPDLPWQQALLRIAGEARTGSAQLAATTDGVSFIDVTEPVVDVTEPEPVVDVTEPAASVPAQRAAPRKRTTPRAGTKSR